MAELIQLRRGDAADWAAANPVLAAGEPGVELDTGKHKIGDGTTAWGDLPYSSGGGGTATETTFTPTGNLAATDVQTALAELDTEKAPAGHSHTAAEIGAETPTGAQAKADAAEANANAYTDTAIAGLGGAGGSGSGGLLVLDGVNPLQAVGSDTDGSIWLYADADSAGAVTDHGALTGLTDNDHTQYVRGQVARSYQALGGVLRKVSGSWVLLNDATHRPLGLGAVSVTSSEIAIAVTPAGSMVTTVSITADETYAADHTAGASVSRDELRIKIYKNGTLQNPLTMPDSGFGNFWISGLMEG